MPHPISIEKNSVGANFVGFVVPPTIHIGSAQGDTVTWTNNTNTTGGGGPGVRVRLWFPNGARVFQPPTPSGFSDPFTIVPGATFSLAINAAPHTGYYKYTVYCEDPIFDLAHGNSEPGLHVP